jgi:hypothetical protein
VLVEIMKKGIFGGRIGRDGDVWETSWLGETAVRENAGMRARRSRFLSFASE